MNKNYFDFTFMERKVKTGDRFSTLLIEIALMKIDPAEYPHPISNETREKIIVGSVIPTHFQVVLSFEEKDLPRQKIISGYKLVKADKVLDEVNEIITNPYMAGEIEEHIAGLLGYAATVKKNPRKKKRK